MEETRKRILINRVLSFVVGGVLVFGVMSFTVLKNVRTDNEGLTSALDTSRYEAGRLLSDAEALIASGDFDSARESLEMLFANQPGSQETVDGRVLLITLNEAQRAADARWAAAVPAIRAAWSAELAAAMRSEADADRAQFEVGIDAEVLEAWMEAKDDVREAFEAEA